MKFGTWDLGLGAWDLEPGIYLEDRINYLLGRYMLILLMIINSDNHD